MDALVQQLIAAAKTGQWVIVAGVAILLLVLAARWLVGLAGREIPTKALPWISAILGTLAAVGAALCSAIKIPWWQAAMGGLISGATASGLWSLLGSQLWARFHPSPGGNGPPIGDGTTTTVNDQGGQEKPPAA